MVPAPPSGLSVTGSGSGLTNGPVTIGGKGQPGDTVQVYGSSTGPDGTIGPVALAAGTITVGSDGSWSVSGTAAQLGLPDGQWVFWSTESSGGLTSAPSGKTPALMVDTTPPKITIGGDGFTTGGTVVSGGIPTFTIGDPTDGQGNQGSGVNGSATTYTLDGNPYVPGTPVTAVGQHTLSVYACDNAGNCTSSTVEFTVVPAPPSGLSVTGSGSGLTNGPVTIGGKGQPGDTVQVYGSSTGPNGTIGPVALAAGTITVGSDGSWSLSARPRSWVSQTASGCSGQRSPRTG